jgi:hypothetical protein
MAQLETFLKKWKDTSPSALASSAGNTAKQQPSMDISTLITSLTSLQSSFGNPCSKFIYVGDITPIFPEEMPPSYLFFNKKWRTIVK